MTWVNSNSSNHDVSSISGPASFGSGTLLPGESFTMQFDLVGTIFEGHPDLRRIMMPEDWPGHPLRRDYAIDTAHFPWR